MSDTDIPVLIADDDPDVCAVLRRIIDKAEGFTVVGEAADGVELMRLYNEKKPGVVFLDVDMPAMSGIDCAVAIQDEDPACVLIFATGHEEYRSEAFSVYAFDYLVKPFNRERVLGTLKRIRGRHLHGFQDALSKPAGAIRPVAGRLMLRHREGVTFVNASEILLIQREERSTVIYTENHGRYVTSETMAETEERLDHAVFFRCHKSYIVNLNKIRDITPYGRWTYVIRLTGTDHDALITHEKYDELEKMFG
jgi:two-component system, LytTR family, response regulator